LREVGFLNAVLELFEGDEIDELELEAIAALVVNFGSLPPDEARVFAAAVSEYQIDSTNPIVVAFLDFVNASVNPR
jgi:hydroxyethylthiazole kinase-like sugar kinase family protein